MQPKKLAGCLLNSFCGLFTTLMRFALMYAEDQNVKYSVKWVNTQSDCHCTVALLQYYVKAFSDIVFAINNQVWKVFACCKNCGHFSAFEENIFLFVPPQLKMSYWQEVGVRQSTDHSFNIDRKTSHSGKGWGIIILALIQIRSRIFSLLVIPDPYCIQIQ